MFQNEMPYDPPNQASLDERLDARVSPPTRSPTRSRRHEAWGVGSYCYFNSRSERRRRSTRFEVPDRPGVKFHDLVTVSLGGKGAISNVVNHAGGASEGRRTVPSYLAEYPAK